MSDFQNTIAGDSTFSLLLNTLSQVGRPATAYALGGALYAGDWALFARLWNESLNWLSQMSPELLPIDTSVIASAIVTYSIPLVVETDGTLSIVV